MDPLVLITGASSGIGQALALRYHQAGWRLALIARRSAEIERWAHDQAIEPSRYAVYGADVADTDSIVAAGHACIAAQGVPDVVIANAGISVGVDTAAREDIDILARSFATNVVGVAATFHPFVTLMAGRGSGCLVESPAWPGFGVCRVMALTAPARRPSSPTARACAAKCGAPACAW